MARLLNATRERDKATTKEGRQNTMKRLGRIIEIGERYTRNIAGSKQFTNDFFSDRGVDGARGRQYSQNTYMGINAG